MSTDTIIRGPGRPRKETASFEERPESMASLKPIDDDYEYMIVEDSHAIRQNGIDKGMRMQSEGWEYCDVPANIKRAFDEEELLLVNTEDRRYMRRPKAEVLALRQQRFTKYKAMLSTQETISAGNGLARIEQKGSSHRQVDASEITFTPMADE